MAGTLAPLAGLMLLAGAASAQALTPREVADLAFAPHPGAALAQGEQLRDESGRSLGLDRLVAGMPTLLVFDYFHCPNLCGLLLSSLGDALTASGLQPERDYRLLAISIDPRETPADAAAAHGEYAARFPEQIGGWHFLTGEGDVVTRLAARAGFPYRWDEALHQYAHPAGIILLQPGGRIADYLTGLAPEPGPLRDAVAAARAPRGTASPARQLLLLCFGLDPAAGRHNTVAIAVARITALAALGGLATLIWRLAPRSGA